MKIPSKDRVISTDPFILALIAIVAFFIRLFSVLRFESVIHEFDPWFNFRATQYLVKHGWTAFLNWFDERAWFPLGRVVGGTVYPGLMVTAAFFHHVLNNILKISVETRDICVFLAPAFSALTAIATYAFTRTLKDNTAGLLAAAMIAICPGYISRSVAGSYDNEAISIFLMMATFALWNAALKRGSALFAALTAMSYYYMAASWGGYVFIINLIPLHVFVLLCMGRYSEKIYRAYCTFWVLGTLASMTIRFVAFQPISTNEHMAALGVFCLLQLCAAVNVLRELGLHAANKVMMLIGAVSMFIGFVASVSMGWIAPWTGRFYSLWDTNYARSHIPIIASVSEHQPTTWSSFFIDLHMLLFLAPVGLFECFVRLLNEHVFAIVYALTATYFAGVMVRLILTLAPLVCVLSGIALSTVLDAYQQKNISRISKVPIYITFAVLTSLFVWHCTWVTSSAYSSPSIILASYDHSGAVRIIDDFREAFQWLRYNTPHSAKILAWWDYGYQISGMSDRITIVDNNTWNNTHIATVGLILGSSEENAYPILRQLQVDYLLVLSGAISGFSGDDINKFLWMIRIASGVYPDRIHEDSFYSPDGHYRVDAEGASESMRNSILYKMVYYGIHDFSSGNAVDRVRNNASLRNVNPKLSSLEEVYTTDHFIVRIYRLKQPDVLGRSFSETLLINPA